MAVSYARTAEFYDLVSTPRWEWLEPSLRDAFATLSRGDPVILDVGAGTGRPSVHAATVLPRSTIVAVEPDPVMRGILLSRIWDHPEVRDRITVLPADVLTASKQRMLPDRVDAILLLGILGHFTPEQRKSLWQMLYGILAKGGVVIAEAQPPNEVKPVESALFSRCTIGDMIYEGWSEGIPAGNDTLTWQLTYRVHGHAGLLYESCASYTLWPVTAGRIRQDMEDCGLEAADSDCDLLVFRKPG